MAGRKRFIPSLHSGKSGTGGILELDRFTNESLERWTKLSEDFDLLQQTLYFKHEAERRIHRPELLEALRSTPPQAMSLSQWVRVVPYQFANTPLSCAGSLRSVGARFNAGIDLDEKTLDPWPALYVAEDFETAMREKFNLAADDTVEGLTRNELALMPAVSHISLRLEGQLSQVYNLTCAEVLQPVARVLRKIELPESARRIAKRLGLSSRHVHMLRTSEQIYRAISDRNWRQDPIQFGLPAHPQILGELIRAAGFEGILYRSTKGPGRCLAVFPDRLLEGSFVSLMDKAPESVKHARLDTSTAEALAGWDTLPRSYANTRA